MVSAIQARPDAAAIADPANVAATAAADGGFGGVLQAAIGQSPGDGDEPAADAGGSETPAAPLAPPAKDLASVTAGGSLAALALLMFGPPQPLALPPKAADGDAPPPASETAAVATAGPEAAAGSALAPAAVAVPEPALADAPHPAGAPEAATNAVSNGGSAVPQMPARPGPASETPMPAATPPAPSATIARPSEAAATVAAQAAAVAAPVDKATAPPGALHAGKPARSTKAGDADPTGGADKIPNPPPDGAATNTEGVVRFAGNAQNSQGQGQAPEQGGGKPAVAIGAAKRGQAATATPVPGDQRPAAANVEALAATDAASEAAPTAPPAPAEQVAHAVVEQVRAGGGDAVVRLDPKELGAVSIRVRTDHSQVRIEVRAERPEALQVLRDSTPDLASLLNARGLDLTNVSVSLAWSGGPGNGQQESPGNRRGPQPADGEFAGILGLDGNPAAERHNRLRSAYNPDGGHLYRV
ncbi:MAG: flagellar hook-length control protein FliK [Chloroflexi bacterium]|nr:flagellar hook-length control protein FliK [Chloroflexota bacterium]